MTYYEVDPDLLKLVISSPANVTVPLDGDETMLIVRAVIYTVLLFQIDKVQLTS